MPLDDTLGDHVAHVLAFAQLVHAGGEHVIERGEASAQRLGDSCADMEDAQAIKHAPHVALLAGLHAVQEVARGLLAHPLKARDLGELE